MMKRNRKSVRNQERTGEIYGKKVRFVKENPFDQQRVAGSRRRGSFVEPGPLGGESGSVAGYGVDGYRSGQFSECAEGN